MKKDYINIITSFIIFGTIGVVRNFIDLPSTVISFGRGLIATLFLLTLVQLQKRPMDKEGIKNNLRPLVLLGVLLGVNWVFLFEAYRYTTVSAATMALYMQPTFLILASPLVLKEPLSLKKFICAMVAVVGMVLVSGVLDTGLVGLKGIAYGLVAAMMYATIIIINKFVKGVDPFEKTLVQLFIASIVLLIYIFVKEDLTAITITPLSLGLLLVVGIIHTGIPYTLYFGAVENLPGQTVALLSYIDPIIALILSALILKESLTLQMLVGSVLVLGSALVGERLD